MGSRSIEQRRTCLCVQSLRHRWQDYLIMGKAYEFRLWVWRMMMDLQWLCLVYGVGQKHKQFVCYWSSDFWEAQINLRTVCRI